MEITSGAPTAPPLKPPEIRLNASDYRAYDFFGSSVSISSDVLAAGAPGKDTLGEDAGGVYVFERQGDEWLQQTRLAGENLDEKDGFGYSLALDQNRIAVSAWDIDPQRNRLVSSAVYVYQRQGQDWVLETKLTQETPSGMFLGSSMDLEGDTLVIGSGDAAAGIMAGAVLIYKYGTQGWQQQARLVPADGAYFTALGSSVDLVGDLLVVGAGGDLLVTAPDEFGGPVFLYEVLKP